MSSAAIVFFWLLLVAILILVGLLLYFLIEESTRKKGWVPRIKNSVFLEVQVPKESEAKDNDPKKEEKDVISIAEQFFTTIADVREKGDLNRLLGINENISLEIAAVGKKISFYLNVPKKLQALIEKQLHAQYPTAQIETIKPYKLFKPDSAVAAVELGLQKNYIFPIRTYKETETDPLNSLTNSLSKLTEDEGAAIQLIISPAGSNWQAKPRRLASQIQQGKDPGRVTASGSQKFVLNTFDVLGNAFNELLSGKKKSQTDLLPQNSRQKPLTLTPMQQEIVKRFEEKASRAGFTYNLRLVASSSSEGAAQAHLKNILSSFMQYSMPPFNGFKVKHKPVKRVVTDFIFRIFRGSREILNTEELASIWHLPTRFTETPHIKWLGSKKGVPPHNLPEEGLLLGKSLYRGVETKVYIKHDDRRRHMYIIGRTGTGKTELMKNLAIQDIRQGEGLCVVDPHGDLVDDLLSYIPKERADDVILFEPFDLDRPVGLNMLEAKGAEQKDFVIQEMISIFYKLFPPEMIGPMFEHNMRNVMLTLLEDKQNPGTIADIPRMFTDTAFQRYKLSKVQDPVVRAFWEKEMAKTSDFHKSEMLGYLISKVGRFVENEMMRNIIGQPTSSFDFRKVMDEGKILLINLSKGKTGEVNAKLLGLIVVSKLQMAAMSRADQPEDQRRDFYLYVDEFQNFVTDSFATILSEARKYRLDLIMAHQFISQLTTEKEGSNTLDSRMRDAVFGNAGTMITFRIGVEDAEIMGKEFAPVFNEFDVVNIDRYNAYVKLMIDGTASRPFSMETYPKPTQGDPRVAQTIKNLSKLKYGRPKSEVEEEILRRTRLGSPVKSGIASTERTG
ncbi:MAG: type IV secretion system DNA-binding domain-containing protein [Candidatus Doudnabacteria bacterium]|nr:type IV secretion system DNA-binding domain-containing protein [Candidatus Doudnabacteria bacterium]